MVTKLKSERYLNHLIIFQKTPNGIVSARFTSKNPLKYTNWTTIFNDTKQEAFKKAKKELNRLKRKKIIK